MFWIWIRIFQKAWLVNQILTKIFFALDHLEFEKEKIEYLLNSI